MSPYNRHHHSRKRPVPKRFGAGVVGYVMGVITIIICTLLLLAYLTQYISPVYFWFPALLGLIVPMLYILCTLMLLYWTIRWHKMVFIPLAVLLLGAGNISKFIKLSLSKNHTLPIERNAITVLSYNVMGFINFKDDGTAFSTTRDLLDFVTGFNPDILCFQEFQTTPTVNLEEVDKMLLKLAHKRVHYKIANGDGTGWGLAIYTRLQIINSGIIEFNNPTTNSAQWADVVRKRDTIRVFNAHLQTTMVNSSDKEFIMNQEYLTSEGENRIHNIISKLKLNYITRASQADTIATLIHNSPYDVVICGDFNDTPMSYAYSQIRGGLVDSFVEKGRGGTNNTYRGFFNMFRIDYVLHSKSYQTLEYDSPENLLSDHNPVVVVLKKRQIQ